MTRKSAPHRTRSTWLSDEELLILDPLFDLNWPLWALSASPVPDWSYPTSDYELNVNVRWSHGLSDSELEQAVEKLERSGLVRTFQNIVAMRPVRCLAMTSEGGRLWSLERRPDWSKYVGDTWPTDEGGLEWLELAGFDRETILAFLGACVSTGFVELAAGVRSEPVVVDSSRVLPWRTGAGAWFLRTRINPRPDFERPARPRAEGRWWSSIGDLIAVPD